MFFDSRPFTLDPRPFNLDPRLVTVTVEPRPKGKLELCDKTSSYLLIVTMTKIREECDSDINYFDTLIHSTLKLDAEKITHSSATSASLMTRTV